MTVCECPRTERAHRRQPYTPAPRQRASAATTAVRPANVYREGVHTPNGVRERRRSCRSSCRRVVCVICETFKPSKPFPRVTSDRVSANQLALQVPGPGEDCAVCRRLLQESYSPVFSVAVVSPAAGAAQTQGQRQRQRQPASVDQRARGRRVGHYRHGEPDS